MCLGYWGQTQLTMANLRPQSFIEWRVVSVLNLFWVCVSCANFHLPKTVLSIYDACAAYHESGTTNFSYHLYTWSFSSLLCCNGYHTWSAAVCCVDNTRIPSVQETDKTCVVTQKQSIISRTQYIQSMKLQRENRLPFPIWINSEMITSTIKSSECCIVNVLNWILHGLALLRGRLSHTPLNCAKQ